MVQLLEATAPALLCMLLMADGPPPPRGQSSRRSTLLISLMIDPAALQYYNKGVRLLNSIQQQTPLLMASHGDGDLGDSSVLVMRWCGGGERFFDKIFMFLDESKSCFASFLFFETRTDHQPFIFSAIFCSQSEHLQSHNVLLPVLLLHLTVCYYYCTSTIAILSSKRACLEYFRTRATQFGIEKERQKRPQHSPCRPNNHRKMVPQQAIAAIPTA